jgi:CHAT domain-containing protein
MDTTLFLQHLCSLSIEDGCTYIQAHIEELGDHAVIGVALSDYAIAQMYNAPFASLKLAELLILFSDRVHHAPSHALGLNVKGNALRSIGHHQAALECLDAAGEEFLRLGDEVGWARTRVGWIISAAWVGGATEALQVAARARDAFLRHGEYYRACTVDHNTAGVYTKLGRYQDALELYDRMLTIYPTLSESEARITQAIGLAECNSASNLVWLGKFEQAYHLLQQAKQRLIAIKQMGLVVLIESNLAELDYSQGYYGSALQHYYQAHDLLMQNEVDDPFLLAQLKLWMAKCFVKLNRAQEACQSASEAVETCRQFGVSLDTGDALRQYATALLASDQPDAALIALDEAWRLFTRGGFEHYAHETKLQHAEVLLEIGSSNTAYEEAGFARQFFDSRGLVLLSARAGLVMVGALIEQAQQTMAGGEKAQEAFLLCKQLTLQARKYNLQEQVYKGQHLLGRLAALQDNLERATRHYGAAIAQIERILDNLVHDLSPSFLHTAWAVFEDMIVLCLRRGRADLAFSYLERARSVVLRQYLNKLQIVPDEQVRSDVIAPSSLYMKSAATLRVQHEIEEWQQTYHKYSTQLAALDTSASPAVDRVVIEAELKLCEAKLSELFERLHLQELDTHVPLRTPRSRNIEGKTRSAQRIDVNQLRKRLAPEQLLLAYFLCNGKLIIFAITAERLTTHEVPAGAAELEHLILLLHAHLQPQGWPDPQRPPQQVIRSLLNMLYDLLIAPVAELLPPSGYLTIVPYGPLHDVPFHALYDGSHFLIEDFQINYLPASSILPQLGPLGKEGNMRVKDAQEPSRMPLVLGYSSNGSIRRAIEEAKALAALLGGRCYLEDEATIARLVDEAPGSPIVHLATHGQSRLDAPNFSSILLADGQFNAIDAFGLNLQGCELVTLSGCETGLALSGGGDEQLGLGRAFLAAGASSLLMSLWPAEDSTTSELMQFFYQRLLRGDSKVQALRAAQCDVLKRTSSMYSHPYFWAAFRLVGDASPLGHAGTNIALLLAKSRA